MKQVVQILLLTFLFPVSLFAQIAPGKYFVAFTDKNNNPFSVSNPSAYLSQRAIDRRNNQNISIAIDDLPVTPAYVDSVTAHGALVLNKTKWLNGVIIQTNDTNVLNAVRALPFVSGIKSLPHQSAKVPADFRNRDKFEELNLLKNISSVSDNPGYGGAWNQLAMLNGDFLHDSGFRGTGKLIAVLDAGFEGVDTIQVFNVLRANNRIISTHDFVEGDSNVYAHHNHGTCVLSTMAGNLPGTMIGTAPDASYILLRTEDAASEFIVEEYLWACGAEYADSAGADIFNSSLGYTTFNDPLYNHSYADMNGDSAIVSQAADIAASKGILVVVSAGNSGGSPWNYIGAPADADSALAVGAVDSNGAMAGFSSHGYSFDGRVKPNVCAQGLSSFLAFQNGGFGTGSGTSFASPIMAGVAACLWQSCPIYTNMQILHAIEASAHLYFTPDTLYGYGIPDFQLACLILKGNTPLAEDDIISLYPNPFSTTCDIQYYTSHEEDIHAEVFDIIGKKVLDKMFHSPGRSLFNFSIDSYSLPQKGAYILRLTTTYNTFVRKMIRN